MRNDRGRFIQRFRNQFGEDWEFEYVPEREVGILRGSDDDWREHQVRSGRVPELILDEDELSWLRAVWIAATGERPGALRPPRGRFERFPAEPV